MKKNTYSVLIVGGGSIGERHARAWNQTQRASTITVCDPFDERRVQAGTTQREAFPFPAAVAESGLLNRCFSDSRKTCR